MGKKLSTAKSNGNTLHIIVMMDKMAREYITTVEFFREEGCLSHILSMVNPIINSAKNLVAKNEVNVIMAFWIIAIKVVSESSFHKPPTHDNALMANIGYSPTRHSS